ncbi:Xenotropic and polytropic retrovirus receptor 1 [Cladophialophora chaetospira]|uniref:Xenotropic and polytropic retrovirus receptor 1 n=1 Tax=Cladophialophora chaetospira TaxID=386627 RepID=A0AA38XQ98_9EURO|nr:Xenotropic and polytropic retrovirus receptor 1 [Cladophialophora chaetospira]
MKFAKELEEDAVPEWRVKYLNYKARKKKIKAISKALKALNKTPGLEPTPGLLPAFSAQNTPYTHYDFNRPPRPRSAGSTRSLPQIEEVAPDQDGRPDNRPPVTRQETSHTMFAQSPPILIPGADDGNRKPSPERTPLYGGVSKRQMNYGSIVGTPPEDSPMGPLELPDPALTPQQSRAATVAAHASHGNTPRLPPPAQVPASPDAYHVGETSHPPRSGKNLRGSLAQAMFKRRKPNKTQSFSGPPISRTDSISASKRFRKLFSPRNLADSTVDDLQMSAYKELDERQAEFFSFLDKELKKIEEFYKLKEDEATERLQVLRSQLHEMRDRRMTEILRAKHEAQNPHTSSLDGVRDLLPDALKDNGKANGNGASNLIPKQIEDLMGRRPTIGKTSQAMAQMSSPPGPRAQQRINEGKKDYVRRDHGKEVKYTFAKRRLKVALQEFYRGLELLKSYTLLNRTGFRKINKKYDKASQARPPLRYMSEKINNAYFVTSDVIDNHLMAVEDLYSRYFERGNHKMAVKKLRSRIGPGDLSGVAFRNGLYLASGVCFATAGLVDAYFRLDDPRIGVQTSYLLQLYAGYFLIILLFLIFALDCRIWARNHINYIFIFEYDTRHVLDWRQLAELPCLFAFLNGLFIYLNFRQKADDWFYTFWPLFLIIITVVIIFLPFPFIYGHARMWWAESNLRLICAPFYPVEFRDFYLGDMYCSQTYAMGQIEVFFCLYVNGWHNPPHCNSSHSRLLGFFAALPAVWRALQCLRRYYDSRNWFPHLANCLKYFGNIAYYMTLSIYRIDMSHQTWAIFVTFALVNGVYCSFWDVYLDWSLGDLFSDKHPFLRERLGYKQVWIYYVAIVADVVLRQQWIFYAIFAHDVQHSAIMSFFVSLAEVLRRGMWSLFRVENEHCNNVGKFRASRDIPLPYDLPDSRQISPVQQRQTLTPRPPEREQDQDQPVATGVDVEAPSPDASMRQRRAQGTPKTPAMRAIQRVGTIIGMAHAQDFERRRKPPDEMAEAEDAAAPDNAGSSDEDDDAEGSGGEEEFAELQRQREQDSDHDEAAEADRLVSRATGNAR